MQDILTARPVIFSGTGGPERSSGQPPAMGNGGKDRTEQLGAAAKEFEALFLGYILKVMRETVEDAGLTEKGLGQSTYTDLFDQEVARSLAGRGALGISDMLIRKLTEGGGQ